MRSVLQRALESEGFSILEAATEHEALDLFSKADVDLVTLDLKLRHADGLQLAREMRAIRNVPLIMITGMGSEIDRIVGLEHGADDYIVKPFNMRETMLRIRNVLRRYEAPLVPSGGEGPTSGPRVCAFDHCILDLVKRELRSTDGDLIDLTDAEFRLLTLFVENPTRVLSRDEIARHIQGHDGRRSIARSTDTSLGSDASSRGRRTSRGSSRPCEASATSLPAKSRCAERGRATTPEREPPRAPCANRA